MFADLVSIRVAHFAGLRGQVAAQELAEITLADEADACRILLVVRRQPSVARDAAQVGLLQFAYREQGRGQLFLAQLMQEITLVLAAIHGTQQLRLATRMRDARIVPGLSLIHI